MNPPEGRHHAGDDGTGEGRNTEPSQLPHGKNPFCGRTKKLSSGETHDAARPTR
jgi:hypothetical protein